MGKSQRTGTRGHITPAEVILVILVIAALAALLLPGLARQREESRMILCRRNLHALFKGMATYLPEYGSNRFYPCPLGLGQQPDTYNGAEWLAALHWSGVVPWPGAFLCPSSGDTNADGKDIGSKKANDCGGRFSSQTVSYAALWWKSVSTRSGGAILHDFPPDQPMACDDTQGGINHGDARRGGMSVLFFDSHVEFKAAAEVDITSEHGSVGQGVPNPPKTLLWRLKN